MRCAFVRTLAYVKNAVCHGCQAMVGVGLARYSKSTLNARLDDVSLLAHLRPRGLMEDGASVVLQEAWAENNLCHFHQGGGPP